MNRIFGVRFDPSDHASITRIADAAGLSYGQQTGSQRAASDFDRCYPWSQMKECNLLPDGSVVYRHEAGFSRSQNTFIEVPRFYFKRTVTGNTEEWLISGRPHEGFTVEPWFIGEDGSLLEKRYIAKYEGCDWADGLVSVTGQTPQRYHALDELRAGCKSAGFALCSVYAYLAIQHLFVIECGTLDSQSVNSGVSWIPYSSSPNCIVRESGLSNVAVLPYHWRWETVEPGSLLYVSQEIQGDLSDPHELISMQRDGDFLRLTLGGNPISFVADLTRVFGSAQPTGLCDHLESVSGRPTANLHTAPFLYRGIENLYGNAWERMDCVLYDSPSGELTLSGERLSYSLPYNHSYGETGKGFVARLGFDPDRPWATFACALGAEKDSHYCGEWSTFSEETGALVFGGGWDHFHCNGIFTMRSIGWNRGNWLYGYRAMK